MNSVKKSIAIVYATYDGAVNSTCGVGVLSQYFIGSMPSIIKKLNTPHVDYTFHVIAVDLASSAHGYSSEIATTTKEVCQSLGGKLWFVSNGTNGNENYGSPANWQEASRNAAECLEQLARQYDHVLTYLVDTPFLHTPYLCGANNVTSILVPHSDVYSHFPDNVPKDRQAWEADAFTGIAFTDKLYLASTSQFLTDTLQHAYNIPKKKIVNLQTGINIADKKFDVIAPSRIKEALMQRGIPLNKKLIFSVARAVPYKGFETLIEAFSILNQRRDDIHLVFIASPFRNSPSNVGQLKQMIKSYGLEEACTAIFDLDMDLPKYICQWRNTKIVAQLSYREPFGLVPEEVRMWGRMAGPLVLASEVDGFVEQIDDNVDGYVVVPKNAEIAADKIDVILNLSPLQIDNVRRAGYKRCIDKYDYTHTVNLSIREMTAQL